MNAATIHTGHRTGQRRPAPHTARGVLWEGAARPADPDARPAVVPPLYAVEINPGPSGPTPYVSVQLALDMHRARGIVHPVSGDHRPTPAHPHGRPRSSDELIDWERSEMGRTSRHLERSRAA